jgi:hypothetical protein
VRTWQFIAVATVLYFGSAAPAAADELPLVPTEVEVAAVVETIAADVAPDVVPLAAEVSAQEPVASSAAAPEPAPTAQPPPEAQQESQYHAPEPQYQPSSADAVEPVVDAVEPTVPAAEPSEALADEPAAAPAPDPAASPTAATVENAAASPNAAPDTWIWNWTWNCDPNSAPPAQSSADASASNWVWNWTWNCDREPITGGDASQYQGATTQYQPENVNVSIRVLSPGDNGPVTQTISAAAAALATTAATVEQTVVDATGPSIPMGVSPSLLAPVDAAPTLPPLVMGPDLTSVTASLVPLPEILLPVLPPLELSLPPLEVPAAAAAVVEAVTETLEAAGIQVAATRSAAPPRPRSVNAREPQHDAVADAGASWRRPIAIPVASVQARPEAAEPASGSASRPDAPFRPSLPRPNAPAIGSAQLSGSANGVLAAFAALLAAYLLYPYLAARPVRVPRDRRRLRPRVSRFDPPG